ncbi:hypothetical protein [Streptomyces uncialis]|uniref:hypothetical protein n=1 Tax=Streptomyces uncialis TaxID=1048205 RepID=UPI0037B09036
MSGGGLAARVMGWQRRMGAAAGPLAASGEQSTGQPVQVELFVDGVWVDITSHVLTRDGGDRISITRGRRAEGSTADQGTCNFQLNNRDGRYTPRNPRSPYYGVLGKNQAIRVSVPDGLGGKSYRFWGEVNSWPKKWDSSGADLWIDAQAVGPLQRYSRGAVPDRSVIYKAITHPLPDTVVAYWPCEDPEGSARIESALVSGSPMEWTTAPALASYHGFGASDPLPDLSTSSVVGGIARYEDPTSTQVRALVFIPPGGLADGKVLLSVDQADTGATAFWELYYSSADRSLVLRQHSADGSLLGAELFHTLDVRGRQMRISVELQESGVAVLRALRITDLATMQTYSVTDTANLTTLTRVTRIQVAPASRSAVGPIGTRGLPGCSVGHITVQATITAVDDLGIRLNPVGEAAGTRISRLCADHGIAFDGVGDLADTPAMGGQGRAKPLDLLRECELADGGLLLESLTGFGLVYRTRTSLYNQDPAAVFSYPASHLSQVPESVDDDQQSRNRVTVTSGSASATQSLDIGPMSTEEPPAGIGEYGDDLSLNLGPGAHLDDQAAWRLHLGTVDEDRYPQITVNLARTQLVGNPALRTAVLSLRAGDRVVVEDPPEWLPPEPIDQMVVGVTESIDHFQHIITLNCQPASPYSVGVLDDGLSRIDTDGSVLYSDAGASDGVIDVAPAPGESVSWSTDSVDAPWEVRLGGEVVRVNACGPKVADGFSRAVPSGSWGAASTGQSWQGVATGPELSVDGSKGLISFASALNSIRYVTILDNIGDCEVLVRIGVGQTAAGASTVPGVMLRYASNAAFYRCRISFRTDSTITLAVTNVSVEVGPQTATGLTYSPGDMFWLRARIDGQRVRGRIWRDTAPEPPADEWHIDRTVTSNTVDMGSIGLTGSCVGGATNTSVVLMYDDYQVVMPQSLTVTRGINGFSTTHEAGTDVCLARPTTLAL